MIKIRSLNKTYRMGENKIKALDNVNIGVNKGEFAAILGTSGSGKTTLMNIIGCLDKASSGEYFLCGQNVSRLSSRALSFIRNEKIGFIFQGFNLIPTLSAQENVELPLIYRRNVRHGSRERQRLACAALELVGLSERRRHKPAELSGGQQQRVAIARAIASAPDLILADEPCGNLDSKSGKKVMDTISELNRQGRTIVLITHDEKAARSAGKIIRLADGRVC
ncbi:MAG: ABC transporter ATP-binding protein [Oscillospiraceae bacterium]|nr:ABC transporter ATP-binding protein [Oscillospiraceae bacterium]